ncbi:MAG: hypothetical protein M1831_005178 [Alyxoria varia]|nr:MAG: hypothetical protein M1831_005178 [Alyxoria varia]
MLVTRALAPHFTHATGIDPSEGMISTAKSIPSETPNITYRTGTSTSLSFLPVESVDIVLAGQAAHWFPQPSTFHHLHRLVRPGGAIAFFGYGDCEFPQYPEATRILREYAYDETGKRGNLGMYWSQPGRRIVQGLLREVVPPTRTTQKYQAVERRDEDVDGREQELGEDESGGVWEDVQRSEYHPGCPLEGRAERRDEGSFVLQKRMRVMDIKEYIRTWSAYHGWASDHPGQKKRDDDDAQQRTLGGTGDIIDQMIDEIALVESDWMDAGHEVDVEWPTGLVLATRK